MEREITKAREAESQQPNMYEIAFRKMADFRRRTLEGRVVIRAADQPWEQGRQALLKNFLTTGITDTAVQGWHLFVHDIRTHSGRHRHQGGLCIYVLEGKGWTTVDGIRHDWEAGDLILLPVKPQGCEHQHFNAEPGAPCKWLALIYAHFFEALGDEMEQKATSPDWKGHA